MSQVSFLLTQSVPYDPANIYIGTEGNHRLTRILDSIANISISPSKGEVVAAAVQISGMDLKLIVASNNSLPDSTTTYLKEIWDILKQLSRDYQGHHRVPKNSVLPIPPAIQDLSKDKQDKQMRVDNLWRKILRFGHQKLRRRVSKHYLNIISVNEDVAKQTGLELVIGLLKINKPALDQRAPSDKI